MRRSALLLLALSGALLAGCGGAGPQPLSARGLRELGFAAKQEQLTCPPGFAKRLNTRTIEQACFKETAQQQISRVMELLRTTRAICHSRLGREVLRTKHLRCGRHGLIFER